MKQTTNNEPCARNETVAPMGISPQERVGAAAERGAVGTVTKPASEWLKSDGGPIRSDWSRNQAGEMARPLLARLSDVKPKPVRWFWKNKIPSGGLSMIVGLGSDGKTFWTIHLTAHTTNGTDWEDGTPCEEGSVLFFYGEDGLADTYKERCAANGVNQDRVVFIKGAEVLKGKEATETGVTVADIDVIAQAIRDTAKLTGVPVRMVVIDPITNYLGKVSVNSAIGVRSVLHPLQRLAEELEVAIVLIHHFSKGKKAHFQQMVSGSGAFVECCRSVWGICHSPADEGKRFFAPVKFNCGFTPTAVSYKITAPSGKVEVLETDISKSAAEIAAEIATAAKKAAAGRPPEAKMEAGDWLPKYLRDGEKPVKDIYAAAKSQGFSERTIDRVKAALGIKAAKRGFGKGSYSVWVLPPPQGS